MKKVFIHCLLAIQFGYILAAASAQNPPRAEQSFNDTSSRGWWDCSTTAIKTVHVTSTNELLQALKDAQPGLQIVVADGHYTFNAKLELELKGNQCQPIVIKAKNRGKAVISKGDILFKNASWVTFQGFTINTTSSGKSNPILIIDSEYLRLSRLNLHINSKEKSKWVHIKSSSHIRIDHSEFQGRTGPGSYIYVANPSRIINIDHNYFHDRKDIGGNGGESIYLHGLHGHRWDMEVIVEYNLFKNLDAEWELIGIKSHQNIIRYNTFIDNQGTVSIRGGDYNKVYGNYFLNNTTKRTAAVRVQGYYNKIINNYAFGLTHSFIETYWGDQDIPYINRKQRLQWWENHNDADSYAIQEAAYRKSSKNMIAFNTVINSQSLFYWSKKCLPEYKNISSKKRPYVDRNKEQVIYPPDAWLIANNLVINANQLLSEDFMQRGDLPCSKAAPIHEKNFSWIGNVIHNDNTSVNFADKRQFTHTEWRSKNPQKQSTNQLGIYSIKKPIPITNFPLLLGEAEKDFEINKQINARLYIGAKLHNPPLSVHDVGPLSP